MAYQEGVRIVTEVLARLPYVDDLVFAAGDNQAFGE
jgi:hypothetical protein